MKKILLLVLAFAAFYAHARYSFSDEQVTRWLAQHTARAMGGETTACDDYADDVEVSLVAHGRRGHWEVEGGKNEICGYLKQAAAALTVLQASTRLEFDSVKVTRDGFPWRSARVQVSQRMSVSAANIPSTEVRAEDELVLVRTFGGIRIRSLQSKSTGGI
jgi:hypothetical protein